MWCHLQEGGTDETIKSWLFVWNLTYLSIKNKLRIFDVKSVLLYGSETRQITTQIKIKTEINKILLYLDTCLGNSLKIGSQMQYSMKTTNQTHITRKSQRKLG